MARNQVRRLLAAVAIWALVLSGCASSAQEPRDTQARSVDARAPRTPAAERDLPEAKVPVPVPLAGSGQMAAPADGSSSYTDGSNGRLPELTVHYINVGQGDATLVQGPDFTILIDAGRHDRADVLPYLLAAGVSSLDLLIGTHPHADHIGQMDKVIAALPVTEVWLSGETHTSRTYERVLDAIVASDADYHEPRAGEQFSFGSLKLEILNPDRLTGDLHEGSIAVRAVYGQVAFLFTGDAEAPTEQAMLRRGHAPESQILQLGHHGSRTSSSALFLEAVAPEVAIYSAGAGNSYGHPHVEVIDRLAAMGIPVYGTEINGTITVRTDGLTYELLLGGQGQARAPPTVAIAKLTRIRHMGNVRAS